MSLLVLEIELLPAMPYTEALLSVMSSTEDSSVTSNRDSTVTIYAIHLTIYQLGPYVIY